MMIAAVFAALMMQQAAPAVVWQDATARPAAEPPVPAEAAPALPDWARADPYAYERAQCSPMIRSAAESQEACQARVRVVLAANMGQDLPQGMRTMAAADACRQEAAGDRYALQCGAPSRSLPAGPNLQERQCTTRPTVNGRGAVSFSEDCTQGATSSRDEGLKLTFGRDD